MCTTISRYKDSRYRAVCASFLRLTQCDIYSITVGRLYTLLALLNCCCRQVPPTPPKKMIRDFSIGKFFFFLKGGGGDSNLHNNSYNNNNEQYWIDGPEIRFWVCSVPCWCNLKRDIVGTWILGSVITLAIFCAGGAKNSFVFFVFLCHFSINDFLGSSFPLSTHFRWLIASVYRTRLGYVRGIPRSTIRRWRMALQRNRRPSALAY